MATKTKTSKQSPKKKKIRKGKGLEQSQKWKNLELVENGERYVKNLKISS